MACCEHKKDLLNRLAKIEGHLKKVKEMVENGSYCIDVITQSLAVQSALRSVDKLVLKNHLQTCVKDAMISGEKIDEKVEEVIKTVTYMHK